VTVAVPVGVIVLVGVGVGVGVLVAVGVAVAVGVEVAVAVAVGIAVSVDVGVGVGMLVAVSVSVGVEVGTDVLVAVGVAVSVALGVSVVLGVLVGIIVDVAVAVPVGVVVDWKSANPTLVQLALAGNPKPFLLSPNLRCESTSAHVPLARAKLPMRNRPARVTINFLVKAEVSFPEASETPVSAAPYQPPRSPKARPSKTEADQPPQESQAPTEVDDGKNHGQKRKIPPPFAAGDEQGRKEGSGQVTRRGKQEWEEKPTVKKAQQATGEKGEKEKGGSQMTGLKGARMRLEHLQLPKTVLKVLVPEIHQRRTAIVIGLDGWRQEDLSPGSPYAIVQFIILVANEPLVEEADLVEHTPGEGAQVNRIHVLLF